MVEIKNIDPRSKTVYFDDGSSVSHITFIERFIQFWSGRVAGETLDPSSIEHFMRRTSGKNLHALMKGKKMEGILEATQDKFLTTGQKIAIATVVTLIFVAVIVFIVLKNQGMLPGF